METRGFLATSDGQKLLKIVANQQAAALKQANFTVVSCGPIVCRVQYSPHGRPHA